MRIEKTFLLNEISDSVKSSEYVYLVDFGGVKVDEISELRKGLREHGAQFHVVQNTLLRKVGEGLSWPSFTQWLHGQTGGVGRTFEVAGSADASGDVPVVAVDAVPLLSVCPAGRSAGIVECIAGEERELIIFRSG